MKTLNSSSILSLCTFLLVWSRIDGYNYLIVIPGAIKSLHGLFLTIATSLAEADHDVTFITPYPIKDPHPNIKWIQSPDMDGVYKEDSVFDLKSLMDAVNFFIKTNTELAKRFWADERMRRFTSEVANYDVFITMSYLNEAVFPFLDFFNGTFVQVSTPGAEQNALSREGNWVTPAILPAINSLSDSYMTFWERAVNFPDTVMVYLFQKSVLADAQAIVEEYFPNVKPLLSYYDRVSLTLINGHFALDGPVPLLPSQIEIGTINAKKPQPLPKDMEDFVQGSGDAGIIYFSLGSIAKSSQIPADAKRMFIEAFKIIPQRVLWKYEDKDLELPTTVKTGKWMPQQDILGHPKTRLFISHCGNLGTQEAKYHGVPVLAVPIAFDQPRNAARMARKGFALVLHWEALTVDTIVQAINTLINDTSYQERMDTVSRILQDQKDTPAERAVWWLEYVVRHKGAPHLQYAGKRLSLFQYVMLDVIFFWLAVLLLIIFVFVYVIRALCFSVKNTKNQNNKKKRQ